MKVKLAITLALSYLAVFAVTTRAQNYSITSHVIAGGGGTSTGSVYAVTGTIGQPDASPAMSGGNFAVVGGFWSYAAAVQMPGAPFLTVRLTGTNTVAVSWASPSTGYALQENADLGTTNWTAVVTPPTDDGTTLTVLVAPPFGNRFYRLVHP